MGTVPFVNPITGNMDIMPVAMIGAYVPYNGHLHLEEAARVAAIRDEDSAANLLWSISEPFALLSIAYPTSEGTGFDALSVEPATLR